MFKKHIYIYLINHTTLHQPSFRGECAGLYLHTWARGMDVGIIMVTFIKLLRLLAVLHTGGCAYG